MRVLPLLFGLLFGLLPLLALLFRVVFLHDTTFFPDSLGSLSILLVVGFYTYFRRRKDRDIAWLRQHGQLVQATVSQVEESLWRGGNGTRFYYVHSYWQDPNSGKKHTFSTPRLDFDPSAGTPVGSTVPIYIEAGHPEHYYLDLSAIARPKYDAVQKRHKKSPHSAQQKSRPALCRAAFLAETHPSRVASPPQAGVSAQSV